MKFCVLMVIECRGESGVGKWSVVVKDTVVNEHNGSFTDWRITLWGESIDPDSQELLPMPSETDDEDHAVISAAPSTISINPGETAAPTYTAIPTDHQHRPTNIKPGPKPTTEASGTIDQPTDVADITDHPDVPDEPDEGSKTDEHFLPHYFPTFGVSKRTQIWIYGALAIIVLFCIGLGTYFFIVRRRRRRSQRDDYEFEMLEDDDHTGGATGGRRPKRRAGELYDAFAGESDEEQLLSEGEGDDDDPEEQKPYRDNAPFRKGKPGDVEHEEDGVNEKH